MHIKDSPSGSRRSFSGDHIEEDSVVMSPEEDEMDANQPQIKEVSKKEKKPHATRRRVVQSCSECRRR